MPEPTGYLRYTFGGYSGHLIHPDTAAHDLLAVRHSAQVAPWADSDVHEDWGYRIPLGDARNQNCWLIGLDMARFHSPNLVLAYLDFPTHEAANAGLGSRHRLHVHRESWEYYIVLAGAKTLRIEDEEVLIQPGEMVEVFPGVKHTLFSRQAPYRGFTFRVPLRDDKIEY